MEEVVKDELTRDCGVDLVGALYLRVQVHGRQFVSLFEWEVGVCLLVWLLLVCILDE